MTIEVVITERYILQTNCLPCQFVNNGNSIQTLEDE